MNLLFFAVLTVLYNLAILTWWLVKSPFKIVSYLWRFNWGQFLVKSIIAIMVIMSILGTVNFYRRQLDDMITVAAIYKHESDKKGERIEELAAENGELKTKVVVLTAASKSPTLTEDGFNTLVDVLFPKDAGERYKKIVTTCENSTLDPKRINVNKDGTVDLGVSQINDYWHSQRVEKIFNEDFWSAMGDSVKNMVYAAWIYKDQGNFSAWACDSKV